MGGGDDNRTVGRAKEEQQGYGWGLEGDRCLLSMYVSGFHLHAHSKAKEKKSEVWEDGNAYAKVLQTEMNSHSPISMKISVWLLGTQEKR